MQSFPEYNLKIDLLLLFWVYVFITLMKISEKSRDASTSCHVAEKILSLILNPMFKKLKIWEIDCFGQFVLCCSGPTMYVQVRICLLYLVIYLFQNILYQPWSVREVAYNPFSRLFVSSSSVVIVSNLCSFLVILSDHVQYSFLLSFWGIAKWKRRAYLVFYRIISHRCAH